MCAGTSVITSATVIQPQRSGPGSVHLALDGRTGLNRPSMRAAPLDIDDLARRIAEGERAALARGITLVESRRADHQAQARTLLQTLMPLTGRAQRVGI